MNNLILLRHGQSQWNLENRFTGWEDVPLTAKGVAEAKLAGQLMKINNISVDIIFSSILERANKTAEFAVKEMNETSLLQDDKLIMTRDKRLNERDYGQLVGLNKEETAKKIIQELLQSQESNVISTALARPIYRSPLKAFKKKSIAYSKLRRLKNFLRKWKQSN